MPARHLIETLLQEFGGAAPSPTLGDIDIFTRSYIAALLAFSNADDGRPLEDEYVVSDFSPNAMRQIVVDCKKFQTDNAAILAPDEPAYSMRAHQAGHDFYLTRNQTGVSFKDGQWDDDTTAKLLYNSAMKFGEVDFYVGDDGKIHQMGTEGDWQMRCATSPNARYGLIQNVAVRGDPKRATFPTSDEEEEDERERRRRELEDKGIDLGDEDNPLI